VGVLADPPLERAVEHRDLGPQSLEHPRRQLRPLDDQPVQGVEGVAAGALHEAADARGRHQGEHHAVFVRQVSQERLDDPGDLARHLGGRVVLVGEFRIA
jgi:hypothetical protein